MSSIRQDQRRKSDSRYYNTSRGHNPGSILYIGNLPPDIDDAHIRKEFEKYGKIKSIHTSGTLLQRNAMDLVL